jgi:uncharacterized repeat protein (TIGR02543 family)
MNTKKLFGYGKRNLFAFAVVCTLAFVALTGCPTDGDDPVTPAASGDITYSVQVNGTADTATSTEITFTFSASVDSLNLGVGDITVGGGNATKGATLTGTGTTRTLAINVEHAGQATVSITKTGIEAATKNVTVHKAGEPDPECECNGVQEDCDCGADCDCPVCEPSGGNLTNLTGDITISPTSGVTTGTSMTATYSGAEVVTYHWNLNNAPITGAGGRTYSPSEAGSYTVTVSADGYNPKTSAAVVVTGATLQELGGTVSIRAGGVGVTNVTVGTEVTAVYSGSESVGYQWNRNAVPIDTGTGATFTPTEGGVYTVTVSRTGFASVTSAELTINLSGTVSITPHASGLITGVALTASYTGGTETVSYQWKKADENVGANAAAHIPAEPGAYTVTVSAVGYNGKTSDPVTVTPVNITLNPNGGNFSGDTANKTVYNAALVDGSAPAPTRENMTLNGWYTQANGGTKQDLNAVITTDTTLYARWNILPITAPAAVGAYFARTNANDGIMEPLYTGGTTAADPTPLPVQMALGAMNGASDGWANLLAAINTANKYVALDLSASTMTGTEFNSPTAAAGKDKIVSLTLPNAATSIADMVLNETTFSITLTFGGYTNLKTLTAANVTAIGDMAFWVFPAETAAQITFPNGQGPSGLTSVSFPKVTTIGNSAFQGCASLTTVSFPEATGIGNMAFNNTGLTTVTFPKVITIGNQAFSDCTSLTTVSFPEATSIGDLAFIRSGLTSVTFPKVTSLGTVPFQECNSLASVSFPVLQAIPAMAFQELPSLTTVSFPVATSIGNSAFIIPASATGNNVLTSITIAADADLGTDEFNLPTYESGLPNAFIDLYNGSANKAAGTYVLSGGSWSRQ